MPNTAVTPQLTIVSTNTSLTVRPAQRPGGTATYTPSPRASTAKASTVSEEPSGAWPLHGE